MKRGASFWLDGCGIETACRIVEECYRSVGCEVFNSKMRWIKLLDCKDEKKRKIYLGHILSYLEMLCNFFGVKGFSGSTLKTISMDFFRVVMKWYNKYFSFNMIASPKAFEVFERWVSENYGSIERYLGLCDRESVKVKDTSVIVLGKDDLQRVGDVWTF